MDRVSFRIPGCILISGVLLLAGCGRDRDAVATVNDESISVTDFTERYVKYLDEVSGMRDNIKVRKGVLDNMINEKLIFRDLAGQRFDADEAYQQRMQEIREQALMDRYARSISADTITVSDEDLAAEFTAYNSKVSARYLYAKTEQEAWSLRKELEHGETFATLAREVFADPGLANNGGYLGTFGWGDMDPALEDAAFTLPVGKISDPIRLNMGYAIVRVEGRVRNPLVSEYDYAKVRDKLRHSLIHKKIARVMTRILETTTKNLSPRFNDEAVARVFQNWGHILGETIGREPPHPVGEDIASMHLVSFQNESWTVREFVDRVRSTTQRQKKRVRSEQDVRDMCIGLAAREVFLQRARNSGLEDSQPVREQIAHVREEYLLKRWAGSVQDSVGQNGWDAAAMREHYERHKDEYQYAPKVNVAEVLVRTEDEARVILAKLRRGESFSSLARKYSIRLWAAKNGGELGFGTEADFGILGKKFFAARIGQVLGPEKVDPYVGVFKILAREEGRRKTFDESKEQIIEELRTFKRQEAFLKALAGLRSHAAIQIDDNLLANISLK